ncbi:MAG TPA: 30S ribosomal protein S16 [Patescibacteria group bacterium]|nr:30S ribosomal protein S16 [Patescibacteria group bacterium]
MSLVIRLTKTGKKGESKYRVIVKEKRDRRDGKAVEILGWFEKTAKRNTLQVNKDRVAYWKSVGAQMSNTVRQLLK